MSFELPTAGLDAEIAIVPLEEVKPHEAVVTTHVEDLVAAIDRDSVIRDPVIVDRRSSVVLDGMHRVSAAQRLGFVGVPACLVDYEDPTIQVGGWYRSFADLPVDAFREECAAVGLETRPIRAAEVGGRTWPDPPVAVSPSGQFELGWGDASAATVLSRTLDAIEGARSAGFDARLVPDTAVKIDATDSVTVVIPPPDKASIIKAATAGDRFPPNTSRHVIPARPMAVDAPVDLLTGDPDVATETLDRRLADRPLDRLPPGSEYAGRTYEEALLVFR